MANIVQRYPSISNIARFNPFMDIDDWFNDFGMRPLSKEMELMPQIKIDLIENDQCYKVKADIPGVKKEDIKVKVDGNVVTISVEMQQEKEKKNGDKMLCRECFNGSSYRSFTLASNVNEEKTQAKYENGVLELTLPKKNGSILKEITIS